MNFDPQALDLPQAFASWGIVFGVLFTLSLVIALLLSIAINGMKGPARFFDMLGQGLRDIAGMSCRRILAISSLTIKESVRRKALLVFVVFAVLFMFGGWFLSNSNARAELQISVYVSFVLTSIGWLIFPVALILSCWGIPEDIRVRSLHTVVTKPIRRSEIVLGRIIGFCSVGTIVVVAMSALGYIWIVRQVPEEVKERLVARRPLYGSLTFLDRQGNPSNAGINTGDINEFRSFVDGATKARAIWTFEGISPDVLRYNPETESDQLLVENSFQAFRTHKGDIEQVLHGQFTLVNEKKDLRVSLPSFPVYEFRQNLNWIPIEITQYNEQTQKNEEYHLFDDLVEEGKLTIEVRCVDVGQLLGMARPDLFLRQNDNPFAFSFFKSVAGIWLMMVLIVTMGVTFSTFVKGPVATLLLFTVFLVGTGFHGFMNDILSGEVKGAGVLESGIRILKHGNPIVNPKEGALETHAVVRSIDTVASGFLWGVSHIIPNFNTFSFQAYTANGFDVPMMSAIMPALLQVLGFLLPCFLLGYYSLKLRELEAK